MKASAPPEAPAGAALDAPARTLVRHAENAMRRRDYAVAADLLALAGHGGGGHGPADRLYNRALRGIVPRWHFSMLNDQGRNDAYRAAVRARVRPGDLVLDIGTGSGLLALLAAEAGAEHVVSCEAEPLIAGVAREIIADNGMADRITVVEGFSTALRVGADLPRPADVLVSEIFDCGLLGEGALAAFAHAREALLAPDAAVVPGRARVWGRLVDSPELHERNHADRACGFDVSRFNRFRSLEYFSTYLDTYEHRPLTDPFPLMDFDFRTGKGDTAAAVAPPATGGGSCHAIVVWFDLDLDGSTVLSNGPHAKGTHWRQAVQTFDRPVAVAAGERVPLLAEHDGERILVRPDGTAREADRG
ncbi:50S ribosomal protein L11 methyltransferase [Nocardiopsis sp. CNT-189]|uniref:50S ribosomal protein L11 methyltransferase n=1 Tax=Nocardiopsis oceanisediminis TaxID=2816862 RepID=UPI003B342A9D